MKTNYYEQIKAILSTGVHHVEAVVDFGYSKPELKTVFYESMHQTKNGLLLATEKDSDVWYYIYPETEKVKSIKAVPIIPKPLEVGTKVDIIDENGKAYAVGNISWLDDGEGEFIKSYGVDSVHWNGVRELEPWEIVPHIDLCIENPENLTEDETNTKSEELKNYKFDKHTGKFYSTSPFIPIAKVKKETIKKTENGVSAEIETVGDKLMEMFEGESHEHKFTGIECDLDCKACHGKPSEWIDERARENKAAMMEEYKTNNLEDKLATDCYMSAIIDLLDHLREQGRI